MSSKEEQVASELTIAAAEKAREYSKSVIMSSNKSCMLNKFEILVTILLVLLAIALSVNGYDVKRTQYHEQVSTEHSCLCNHLRTTNQALNFLTRVCTGPRATSLATLPATTKTPKSDTRFPTVTAT